MKGQRLESRWDHSKVSLYSQSQGRGMRKPEQIFIRGSGTDFYSWLRQEKLAIPSSSYQLDLIVSDYLEAL